MTPLSGARYETKYYVPATVRTALRADIERLLSADPHNDGANGYVVTTLYFDTPRRLHYVEKVEGIPIRRRYRIRRYESAPELIHLERKERVYQRHRKQRTLLSPEDYEALTANRISHSDAPLLRSFIVDRAHEGLAPCLVTAYRRLAYVGKADRALRVTLDSELFARRAGTFEDTRYAPALALPRGMTILELKWIHAFPFWMQTLVRKYSLRNAAISKYCLGTDALVARGAVPHV